MILGSELVASLGLDRQVWDLGYEVVAVLDDPEEAYVRSADSDLALVDVHLDRDMGGACVSSRLRQEHNLPVVMVSRSDREDIASADLGGVSPCVRLPLEARQLRATLQNALIRHKVEAERRRLEQRMLVAQKAESLGLIGVHIVHDFNNVLQAIIGHVQLASIDLPRSSPAQAVLAKVAESGMAGAALCRQFMLCAAAPATADPVELSAVVHEVQPILRSIVRKGTRISYALAADLPPVEASPAELRQILFNLVLNATDAIGFRRGELGVTTGLRRLRPENSGLICGPSRVIEGDHVFLEVSDDGGGIRTEHVERVFEPFFTTKPGSGGLGLSTVRELARKHDGVVELINREGEGAAFRVYFPTGRPASTF